MNTDQDSQLKKALGAWKIQESLPPRFQERVWQRIGLEEKRAPAPSWMGFVSLFGRALTRPALAGAYVAVLLFAGLGAGYWRAQVENARASEELGTRYVQMMDPYQMPRH